jgi:hypothetical protein
MAQTLTNRTQIPLSLAVWLAADDYQYPPENATKYISVTTLLKSPRQIILANRLNGNGGVPTKEDISGRVAARFGSAVHDGIEKAWVNKFQSSMSALGYPQRVIDNVRINPVDPKEPDIIPVYMEQRFFKEVNGWTVSGQFDFVCNGRLEDFKSTGTFTWINNTKDDDYINQGSMYRWGMPEVITQDTMAIQFIFKDWVPFKANDPKYPAAMLMEKEYKLRGITDTDNMIKGKLRLLDSLENTPEAELPYCNDKELWRGAPTYKYFRDPTKVGIGRSTKNFDTLQEANLRYLKDNRVGTIIISNPEPTACRYCSAFSLCSQKDAFISSGELKI